MGIMVLFFLISHKTVLAQKLNMNLHKGKVWTENSSLSPELKVDSLFIRKIYDEELVNGKCYTNLHSLCFDIGERLSGTESANKAVNWGVERMKALGLDSVYTQEVMVPHWERGAKERGYIIVHNQKINVPICALGGSISTPNEGLQGKLVMVNGIKDLEGLGKEKIQGKIVFYNRPFDQKLVNTGDAYGAAVDQRVLGSIEAAKFGAIGVIIRSMSSTLDSFPHTGIMVYDEKVPKIPAAAISTLAANALTENIKANPETEFYFKQSCRILDPVKSFNVVGEIKGSQYPNEVILIGGHLDSWDLAQGAQDDGAGVVQSLEVLNVFKAMGYKPQRTIRVVFFMSEENGSSGGNKYREIVEKRVNERHIAAIESDDGGFTPRGFGITSSEKFRNRFETWKPLFVPYGASSFTYSERGGGADIEGLAKISSALISYDCDNQRYFDIHHTANDLFSQVNQRELKLGSGAIISLVYLLDKYGL